MRFTVSSIIWFIAAIISALGLGMESSSVYFCLGAGVLWQIAGAIVDELKKN